MLPVTIADDSKSNVVAVGDDEEKTVTSDCVLFVNDESKSNVVVMDEEYLPSDSGEVLFATDIMGDSISDNGTMKEEQKSESSCFPKRTSGCRRCPELVPFQPICPRPVSPPPFAVAAPSPAPPPIFLLSDTPSTSFMKRLVPVQLQQPICVTVTSDLLPQLMRFTSVAAAPQPPSQPPPAPRAETPPPEYPPGPRFAGKRHISKSGLRPVMCYEIPGSKQSYVFSLDRANNVYEVFECVQCKRNRKRTTIKVIGEDFVGDPCELLHRCIPVSTKKLTLQRLTYERRQEIRQKSEGLTKYQLKKKLRAAKEEVARELAEGKEDKPCISSRRGRFVGEPNTINEEPVVTFPSADDKGKFYVFSKCKTTRSYDIYECLLCRVNGKSTSVKACGYEFYVNPCKLSHSCDPVESLDTFNGMAANMDAQEVNDTPEFIIFRSEDSECLEGN